VAAPRQVPVSTLQISGCYFPQDLTVKVANLIHLPFLFTGQFNQAPDKITFFLPLSRFQTMIRIHRPYSCKGLHIREPNKADDDFFFLKSLTLIADGFG
jgi:hypothetical protein